MFLTINLRRICLFAPLFFLSGIGCKKNDSVPEPIPVLQSSDKEISSFQLRSDSFAINQYEVKVTFQNDTIYVNTHAKINLSEVIPVITIKGKALSPASGIKQDFSQPVIYTVTAEDGSERKYTVVLKSNRTIYFGVRTYPSGGIYALDGVYGSPVWTFLIENDGFEYSNPIVHNGVLYIGCTDNNYYAFDIKTGKIKWKFSAEGGIEATATIADSTIYFGSTDDHFYALDVETGIMKWKYNMGGNVTASAVVLGGTVFTANCYGEVHAFDSATGAIKWRYYSSGMIVSSGISISKGVLFVGTRNGYLHAIQANTGTLKWTFSSGGISLEWSKPVIGNNVVYMTGSFVQTVYRQKGSVYAINEESGKLIWSVLPYGYNRGPVLFDNVLYVASNDGYLYALNAKTGNINWKNLIYPNSAQPAISDGTIYIGGDGSWHIYAFAIDGSLKWKYPISSISGVSQPAVN